ncbi:MAG: AraC family transcriptional regulator ligand-binding domain-containing protein [Thiolinea sp.]
MSKFQVEKNWADLLQALGLDVEQLLLRAKLPADLFEHEYAYLGARQYFRLWETVEVMLDDPLFPLHTVRIVSDTEFNPSCFAALSSTDLHQALLRLAKFKPLVGLMRLQPEEQADQLRVKVTMADSLVELPWSLSVAELVFITQLGRTGTGHRIMPLQVTLTQPLQEAGAYTAFFGVEPQITDQLSISFSRMDAQRPFVARNDGQWERFEPELNRKLASLHAEAGFASQVRSVLLELLPAGLSSAGEVAKRLHISTRTLQRRLQQENTHFQQELEATRLGLAKHYLSRSQLPNAQIAFLLGYEDPNSFYRGFHRWMGETPETYRLKQV